MYIDQIAIRYLKFYQMLSNEEKITIISHVELDASEREKVEKALKDNELNKGKHFIVNYEINPAILGGLQIYTEDRFMDLSLASRIERLKDEVNKLI